MSKEEAIERILEGMATSPAATTKQEAVDLLDAERPEDLQTQWKIG